MAHERFNRWHRPAGIVLAALFLSLAVFCENPWVYLMSFVGLLASVLLIGTVWTARK